MQRPGPPSTVFNLGNQRQSRDNFPSLPQIQFGGFRPIKRHLQVPQVNSTSLLKFSLIVLNCCRRRMRYFLRILESLTGDQGERRTRRKTNTIILPPRNQDHFDTTTMVNHIFLWLWFYEIFLRFASRIIRTIKHNSKTEDAGELINIKFWERKYF